MRRRAKSQVVTFAWKTGRSFKVSAELVGQELTQIEKAEGRVTPAAVVDRARSSNNVLHGFFEWDDSKAADQYRIEQARGLIQCVVVKAVGDAEPSSPVRAFVNLSGSDGREYLGIMRVMSDDVKREQLLRKAKQELDEWRARYRGLQEFASVFAAIERLDAA
jgi:hypothetical protein